MNNVFIFDASAKTILQQMFPGISSSLIWREQIPGKRLFPFLKVKRERKKGKKRERRGKV